MGKTQLEKDRFSDFLSAFMKTRNYTNKNIADLCYMSEDAVKKYKAGKRFPSPATLNDLSNGLNIDIEKEYKEYLQQEDLKHFIDLYESRGYLFINQIDIGNMFLSMPTTEDRINFFYSMFDWINSFKKTHILRPDYNNLFLILSDLDFLKKYADDFNLNYVSSPKDNMTVGPFSIELLFSSEWSRIDVYTPAGSHSRYSKEDFLKVVYSTLKIADNALNSFVEISN